MKSNLILKKIFFVQNFLEWIIFITNLEIIDFETINREVYDVFVKSRMLIAKLKLESNDLSSIAKIYES